MEQIRKKAVLPSIYVNNSLVDVTLRKEFGWPSRRGKTSRYILRSRPKVNIEVSRAFLFRVLIIRIRMFRVILVRRLLDRGWFVVVFLGGCLLLRLNKVMGGHRRRQGRHLLLDRLHPWKRRSGAGRGLGESLLKCCMIPVGNCRSLKRRRLRLFLLGRRFHQSDRRHSFTRFEEGVCWRESGHMRKSRKQGNMQYTGHYDAIF